MAKLVGAKLTTQTGFDDKDDNTGIWLEVSADFGKLPLVKAFDIQRKNKYPDQTWNSCDLEILGNEEKDACLNGLGARIGIRGRKGHAQPGNDEWELQPWVELFFDDNSIVTVSGGVFRLKSDNGSLDEKNFATVTLGSAVPPH